MVHDKDRTGGLAILTIVVGSATSAVPATKDHLCIFSRRIHFVLAIFDHAALRACFTSPWREIYLEVEDMV